MYPELVLACTPCLADATALWKAALVDRLHGSGVVEMGIVSSGQRWLGRPGVAGKGCAVVLGDDGSYWK